MSKYWWQEDDDDEDEEDQSTSARIIYLETKNINNKTLSKRFNEIVSAQRESCDSKLYNACHDQKKYLINAERQQELQKEYLTYIDVWNRILYNVKAFGFFEAKARIQIDLDSLENATRKTDIWRKRAYDKTLGVGTKVIESLIKSYSKTIEKHKNQEQEWWEKFDLKQDEIDALNQDVESNLNQKKQIKTLTEDFLSDYKRFELAYPESEFVIKLKDMTKNSYGYERHINYDTIIDVANKIIYGSTKNLFEEQKTKDQGEGR